MERVQITGLEQKENRWKELYFHHTKSLKYCTYNSVSPFTPDNTYEIENRWLEQELGFYPIFLAVGDTEMDIRMTGYEKQWARKIGTNMYQRSGEFPSDVMFSYHDLQHGVFLDYQDWFLVLNGSYRNYQLTEREKKSLFKKSFSKADWLRKARLQPHSVMYVAPNLDLTKADHVSVRNKQSKNLMEHLGFTNVNIVRIKVST